MIVYGVFRINLNNAGAIILYVISTAPLAVMFTGMSAMRSIGVAAMIAIVVCLVVRRVDYEC